MEGKFKQQVSSYRIKDEAGVSLVRGMRNTALDASNPVFNFFHNIERLGQ